MKTKLFVIILILGLIANVSAQVGSLQGGSLRGHLDSDINYPDPIYSAGFLDNVSWTQEDSALDPFWRAGSGVLGNYFYCFGGQLDSGHQAQAFNLTTELWELSTPALLGPGCWNFGSATTDDAIYLIGGFDYYAGWLDYDYVQKFAPIGGGPAGTWTQLANYPIQCDGMCAAWDGGNFIYTAGGNEPTVTNAYKYDIVNNTWTAIADLPVGIYSGGGAFVNGKFYVVGGATTPWQLLAYNPSNNTWEYKTAPPLAVCFGSFCTTFSDSLIYVVGGGWGYLGWPLINAVQVYNPYADCWTEETALPEALGCNSARFVPPDKIISAGCTIGFPPPEVSGVTYKGTGFPTGGSLPAISIQLSPVSPPIQIPASGGSFDYNIAATNNGTSPQQAAVWCTVTLPNGNPYGPVLGPVTVTLGAGQTLSRLRTQNVPQGAPAGTYAFNAYVGVYPNTVWDSDSFPFTKLAGGGSQLWVSYYNGTANSSDAAKDMAVDANGNVYVTGWSFGAGTAEDYATVKYNSAGVEQWVARYTSTGSFMDVSQAVTVDDGGNVYVTGVVGGSGAAANYATIKYNSAGEQQWVAIYNGPGNGFDEAVSIAVDGSGNVYVTGRSLGSGTGLDFATIKYNPAGVQQWVARYNGPANDADYAFWLALDALGNVYVTGSSAGVGTAQDWATIKYDNAGNQIWLARHDGSGNASDTPYCLALDANGNVYVTGASLETGPGSDFATIKYDNAGNQLWVMPYNGLGNDDDRAYRLALDSDGNAYVTGPSAGLGTGYDYATIKYSAAGAQLWVSRYDGPASSEDVGHGIAVSGGDVFVTGYSTGVGTLYDYATFRYDASTGDTIWMTRYNGPGNGADMAVPIAVYGGDVLVSGASLTVSNGFDYATIKYSGGNLDSWMPVESTILGQPLPQECRLEPNYPNPFNASTVLSYQLPAASHMSLRIYDTAGRLVTELVNGWRDAGEHQITFDGSGLPSGIYFAKLEAGDYSQAQKLVLMK